MSLEGMGVLEGGMSNSPICYDLTDMLRHDGAECYYGMDRYWRKWGDHGIMAISAWLM